MKPSASLQEQIRWVGREIWKACAAAVLALASLWLLDLLAVSYHLSHPRLAPTIPSILAQSLCPASFCRWLCLGPHLPGRVSLATHGR